MNIDLLCEKSLKYLKSNYEKFPTTGFLAGGSLANLIWQEVSGNKAEINDIDIFLLNKVIEHKDSDISNNWFGPNTKDEHKLFYNNKDKTYTEDYSGLRVISETKDFYYIESAENDGIYNIINYSSNRKDPLVILESFDLNCTQVGYSIDEDKFYYTESFLDFLNTGEIKIINLSTPSHTAIRLVKKKYDLNATYEQSEMDMCIFSQVARFSDITRNSFTKKYVKLFEKYQKDLDPFFKIVEYVDVKPLLESKGLFFDLYKLEVKEKMDDKDIYKTISDKKIYDGKSLIFYTRNIEKNNKIHELWKKFRPLYTRADYLDVEVSNEDVDFLLRLIQHAPKSINNLRGLKISEQLDIIKTLFKKYKSDPFIAICLLEKIKFEAFKDYDEDDLLLLELSVRKEIVNDYKNKVDKILYPEKVQNQMRRVSDPFDFGL